MPIQRRCHRNSPDETGAAMFAAAARRWPGASDSSWRRRWCWRQQRAPRSPSRPHRTRSRCRRPDGHRPARRQARPGRQLQVERPHRARRSDLAVHARFSAAISLRYGFEGWHFDTPSALGAVAPWSHVNRPAVGFRIAQRVSQQLSLFIAPELEWSYESGASASDAKNFGAVFGAVQYFSPTLVLGVGAGIFRQIDKTRVFPLLIVNWQIDDDWRVEQSVPGRAGRRRRPRARACARRRNGSSPPVPPFATIDFACAATVRRPTASAATRASRCSRG